MPQMPTREQLRKEFDAAIHDLNQLRPKQNLTTGFSARIGDSVFDAGYRALADGCAAGTNGLAGGAAPQQPRLHVVSAPVGSGKTSFTIALITACVRFASASFGLSTAGRSSASADTDATSAPYGCVWVVDQMHTAEEMFVTLNALLPGKVAVWTTDHDRACKKPTKVFNPAARFIKDDLKDHAVAIVTHKMFGGKQGHKARQVLHQGRMRRRVLTVVDEQPDEVSIYEIDMAAAERVRERVKADEVLADTVGPHMDNLVRFMHPRTFGGSSIEKPTDDPEVWRAAEGLQWFSTAEASYFVSNHRGAVPETEAVFGFARALVNGYGFLARDGKGGQSTHFIGYESNLITTPGTLLLDATADLDGVSLLCPWHELREVPHASYVNLKVVHVPSFTKTRLHRFFKMPKNRRDYAVWMTQVIRDHMEPGQRGLVVCKQKLIDEENVPRWREEHQHSGDDDSVYYWDLEGRRLCAVNWGRGIGANTWKDADVVFLFDDYFLPRRTVIARAQGYRQYKATEGALGSMRTLNAKAAAVDLLQEGHLLRFTKQMALRGRGRRYNEHGVCEPQKVVCSGDFRRLIANADRLFPGAKIESVNTARSGDTDAQVLLSLLSRPGLPQVISTKWVAQQMHKPWGNVGKNVLKLEAVQQGLKNLGLVYRGGRGCRDTAFIRVGAFHDPVPASPADDVRLPRERDETSSHRSFSTPMLEAMRAA